MAKINTPSYITGISGKVCGHEENEYRTNSSSGKVVLTKKCNPYKGPATERQIAIRNEFKTRTNVIRKWLDDNRPTKSLVKGTALYQEAQKIKKENHLDNVQAALALYQQPSSPYVIKLPSEGGVRQKHDGSATLPSTPSGSGSSGGSSSEIDNHD